MCYEQIVTEMLRQRPAWSASFTAGTLYGLSAYVCWGLSPLYWRPLSRVSPWEILAHRALGSCLVFGAIALSQKRFAELKEHGRRGDVLVRLMLTSLLLAANWFFFVWAISNGRVLQASLGYFLNPLVTVILGNVFLHERLSVLQRLALAFATLGGALLTFVAGGVPWIAMLLATTFGFYGLLRKTIRVSSLIGSTIESMLLFPLGAVLLVGLYTSGHANFGRGSPIETTLLLGAGLFTAIPLLCFSESARRLPLTILGFLQYVGPIGQFLVAIFVFDEQFDRMHFLAFVCIWIALGISSVDLWRRALASPCPARVSPPNSLPAGIGSTAISDCEPNT